MKMSLNGTFIAATVASMLAAGCAASTPAAKMADASKVQCKESNSCKGNGSCAGVQGGVEHTCKGQNGCAGNLRQLTADECAAIKGSVVAS